MVDFPVTPQKNAALAARLAELGILESDLDESFIRSRGNGGQNVNKVSTCVVLVHRPTGISVRCDEERTQGLNRYRARQRLADLVDSELNGVNSRSSVEAEKARKRKQNRKRKAVRKVREQTDD